ncbi:MAG: hypothetical protein JNK47_02855 [Mesorhizobium sp.]|nr:hypothetical protein [Mesorhizobium sp.]MBL8576140.1 hypothetical protein [Mesorhizobium sp.]
MSDYDKELAAMSPDERKAFDAYESDVKKWVQIFMEGFGVKDPSRPVSARMTCTLIAEIAVTMKQRMDGFQARLSDIEQAKHLPYRGVWKHGEEYVPGNFVTDGGNMYHANAKSSGVRPTDDHIAWTLCVKRGRDGKDKL